MAQSIGANGRVDARIGSFIQCKLICVHTQRKKATIHQLTTMLSTSKNVLVPGHNHLLTTSADEPSFADIRTIIKVSGHQHRWLAGGYELEIGHF